MGYCVRCSWACDSPVYLTNTCINNVSGTIYAKSNSNMCAFKKIECGNFTFKWCPRWPPSFWRHGLVLQSVFCLPISPSLPLFPYPSLDYLAKRSYILLPAVITPVFVLASHVFFKDTSSTFSGNPKAKVSQLIYLNTLSSCQKDPCWFPRAFQGQPSGCCQRNAFICIKGWRETDDVFRVGQTIK